jgi:hypothetical protein
MVVPVQNVNYNSQANINATEKLHWMINNYLNLVCQQKELHMTERNETDNAHKLCKMRKAIK